MAVAENFGALLQAGLSSKINLFTRDEVMMHSTYDDLWVIINENVYDLTTFADNHPGGLEVILEYAGLDCSAVFEDKNHSTLAYRMLDAFKIGKLFPETPTNTSISESNDFVVASMIGVAN
uniref:Cytochrome b5 heme-binding domain-containing protein n=1 Tax=Rhabditophanes sp. KR3021 TaxID=114890 RepID=A0AC35UHH9_9BILA